MKILFLHNGSDVYGASRSLVRLASALAADGADVRVWIPDPGPIERLLDSGGVAHEIVPELRNITRGVFDRKRRLLGFLLAGAASIPPLARKIRALQPDLVHTNTATLPTAGAAVRLAGRPHLWHVRDWFGEFPSSWAWYQRYLVAFSDRVVCVSRTIADQFEPSLRKTVRIIHNGFPEAEFAAVTPARALAFRERFRLGEDPAVGVVGRIKWKRKGQEVFLRAAARLRPAHPRVRFLCIGSPYPGNESHLTELQKMAAGLGMGPEWTVTGDVPDNLGAVAALDLLVHPPLQPEPFAGAIVEAMALGKPVVATDLGGNSEQVEAGLTGLLVPPDDPEALAAGIDRLLRDPALRAEMGKRGRERYLARFSWDPFYRSIRAEYEAVLRHRPAGG